MGAAGAGGCQAPQLTGPAPAVLAVTEVQNPCTRLGFKLFPNGDVLGTMPPAPCAGSPVAIESGAAPVWSFVSSPNPVLKIKVRVRNQATAAVGWPRLALALGGKTVTTPAGTNPAIILSGEVDSLRTDSTAVWLLTGDGGQTPEVLAPGAATASKTLYFRIPPPITEGAFEFSILLEGGQDTTGFPAVAPDSTPAWFFADTNFTSTGIMKRVLKVRFELNATLAQKRAAVDSVGGVVVGGYRLTNDPEGIYYIHIPNVTSVSDLLDRGLILEHQPGVRNAGVVDFGRPSGRRPRDGSGWATGDWSFSRNLSSNENWAFEEVNLPLAWGCRHGM